MTSCAASFLPMISVPLTMRPTPREVLHRAVGRGGACCRVRGRRVDGLKLRVGIFFIACGYVAGTSVGISTSAVIGHSLRIGDCARIGE